MSSPLKETVFERLKNQGLSEDAQLFVITSLESDELLAEALGGTAPEVDKPTPGAAAAPMAGAFINSITVEGFRGVGPRNKLDLHPGPGLTLVVGRNGSGKSSFAEALEVLLTGDNRRWSDRSVVWRDGWRNLHHPACGVEAEFVLEGEKGVTTASRKWAPDAELDESSTSLQRTGQKKQELSELGWEGALDSFRPFLSYNELGSMLDAKPTQLYEAIAKILGLDDLVDAEKRIKDAISIRKKAIDAAKAELAPLLRRLQEIDDERAARCIAALQGKTWNLDAVEEAVVGVTTSPDSADVINVLRQVAALDAPSQEDIDTTVASLRDASEALKRWEGTDAQNAKHLAELLNQALSFHRIHGASDCPVCGSGTLDNSWRIKTEAEVKRLSETAADVDAAEQAASVARAAARTFLIGAPGILKTVADAGIDTSDASVAYKSWAAGAEIQALDELADHLEINHPPLALAVKRLKAEAEKEITRREDLWRPMALDLATWMERAREATEGAAAMKALKEASDWMKQTSNNIRNERFAPIADKTQRIWDQLKQQSSVDLQKITLTGSATQRKVELKVSVDGEEGAALGVMSQGELHALALSLFLPRATLDESPFRFIVIDDPVQSMDPARVDGLARVLEGVAAERQVVVFTHDDRLPRACRLLSIDAKVIEVYRRANSVVELREGFDPVKRYCDDAWAIAKSTELDPKVASNIVGVFCRSAIEAACTEVVTRRRLTRGESHDDLEEILAKAEKLAPLMSLALFDDETKTGEILSRLNKGIGSWAVDTYKRVQEATHKGVPASALPDLARNTQRLAEGIEKMP